MNRLDTNLFKYALSSYTFTGDMITKANYKSDFISLSTNQEGTFKITISLRNTRIIFSDIISSHNKQILLKGFSLQEHVVTISPIKHIL